MWVCNDQCQAGSVSECAENFNTAIFSDTNNVINVKLSLSLSLWNFPGVLMLNSFALKR